ncbi:Ent-kaurene oxidase [Cytospora mali]|uniref:Ent-kaurene oxidase n=1 Tax=Cytospora mali TaxID=578113 RepID=A0A194V505_CYTMA|nr:Ent-kaurene oxidase [Valsa mali var. pyri (nom. inval.)]
MLPESKLSSTAALVDSVMGQYTGVGHLLKDHLTTDICRGSFTRHLGTFLPIMAEELHSAMAEKFQFEGKWDNAKQEEPSVMKLFVESGKDKGPESITARLMILTGAALHTSSMAIAHAVYDLCSMPEYIEPLRLEAQTALAQEKGEWSLSALKRLHRLDSFLKESQRVNHSSFLGFNRKIMSSIRLSDGTILPRGTVVAAPGGPMSRDPKFYDEPQRFDGLRFYRADDSRDVSSARTQDYVGIEPGNLSWGNGRFTCPGRWYAAVMIKLILAKLLLEFDVSFPAGQTERPLNGKYDTDVHPDFDQKIVLRKRPTV